MSAKWNFHRWREPAQAVMRHACDEECRFGNIVLGCNRLHGRIGKPGFQRANARWISLRWCSRVAVLAEEAAAAWRSAAAEARAPEEEVVAAEARAPEEEVAAAVEG